MSRNFCYHEYLLARPDAVLIADEEPEAEVVVRPIPSSCPHLWSLMPVVQPLVWRCCIPRHQGLTPHCRVIGTLLRHQSSTVPLSSVTRGDEAHIPLLCHWHSHRCCCHCCCYICWRIILVDLPSPSHFLSMHCLAITVATRDKKKLS